MKRKLKNNDPLGHAVLAQRMRALPQQLREFLASPLCLTAAQARRLTTEFVICGTGSSLAHAYYLQQLLAQHTGRVAEVRTPSAFLSAPDSKRYARHCLIVLSQGLSPNAQLALRARKSFAQLVVFTAATAAGQSAAGRPERARLLRQIAHEGGVIVPFPLENEYETLLRFTGPLLGYLACYRFVSAITGGLDPIDSVGLLRAFARAERAAAKVNVTGMQRGMQIVCSAQIFPYAQNLEYKLIEGLFLASTALCDTLGYAHGPYQRAVAQGIGSLCLDLDAPMLALVKKMQRRARLGCWSYNSRLPAALRILEYEVFLNALVLRLMRQWRVNQRQWPGQGMDRDLYQIGERGVA